jgi:hypothetical protein
MGLIATLVFLFFIVMLRAVMLLDACRYDECRYAECCGALRLPSKKSSVSFF